MPDFCTCGAELPPDARFCHKCGKPQYDYPGVEVEVEAVPPPPPPIPPPPDISFANRTAVRIGFSTAAIGFLVSCIPFPSLLRFVWFFLCLGAAGFAAVYLYQRRTGHLLNVRSGARMGWITGIFSFTISTVLSTIGIVIAANESGGIAAFYRKQIPTMDPNMEQILNNPSMLAIVMVLSLVFLFMIFTLLSAAGGALGAKVLERQ